MGDLRIVHCRLWRCTATALQWFRAPRAWSGRNTRRLLASSSVVAGLMFDVVGSNAQACMRCVYEQMAASYRTAASQVAAAGCSAGADYYKTLAQQSDCQAAEFETDHQRSPVCQSLLGREIPPPSLTSPACQKLKGDSASPAGRPAASAGDSPASLAPEKSMFPQGLNDAAALLGQLGALLETDPGTDAARSKARQLQIDRLQERLRTLADTSSSS